MPLGSSIPPLGVTIIEDNSVKNKLKVASDGINTKDFEKFLSVQKNLSDATVKNHVRYLSIFLQIIKKDLDAIEVADIQDFMAGIKQTKASETYKNYLSMLKILFRDYLGRENIIKGFKFPRQQIKPKILPSKEELKTFFDALPSIRYKIVFLALASSGLRISELLSADINRKNRMLIPQSHDGSTKKAWFSFYNAETEALLKEYQGNPFETSRNTVAHVFKEAADKTGIEISAQTLRSVFAREMSRAGVQDRFIDAFCGRVPSSVLARHYTEYSPEVLKEIYEKANLKILS